MVIDKSMWSFQARITLNVMYGSSKAVLTFFLGGGMFNVEEKLLL